MQWILWVKNERTKHKFMMRNSQTAPWGLLIILLCSHWPIRSGRSCIVFWSLYLFVYLLYTYLSMYVCISVSCICIPMYRSSMCPSIYVCMYPSNYVSDCLTFLNISSNKYVVRKFLCTFPKLRKKKYLHQILMPIYILYQQILIIHHLFLDVYPV